MKTTDDKMKYENIITDFVFDKENNIIKIGGIFRRLE